MMLDVRIDKSSEKHGNYINVIKTLTSLDLLSGKEFFGLSIPEISEPIPIFVAESWPLNLDALQRINRRLKNLANTSRD